MQSEKHEEGVYAIEYHEGRKTKLALKYRLARRADEAVRILTPHLDSRSLRILDLGTADGLMLQRMMGLLDVSQAVGVDLSPELLGVIEDPGIHPVLANGLFMPFDASSFDLIVATAVIEHASDPLTMLGECRRILSPGGFCVVTTPDPFWERVATGVGHLPDEGHNETMDLKRLSTYLERAGFDVIDAYKFMVSPWGLPAELLVERVMRTVGLSFMLLNQIVLARKAGV